MRGRAAFVVGVAMVASCGVEDLRDEPPVTQPPVTQPPEPAPPPPMQMVVEPKTVTVAKLRPATFTVRVPDRAKLSSVLNIAATSLPLAVTISSVNVGMRDDTVTMTVSVGANAEYGLRKAKLSLSSTRGIESGVDVDLDIRGTPGFQDESFGGGLVVRPSPPGTSLSSAEAVAIDANGKIVVLSRSNGRVVVMRLGSQSEWDASFGNNGVFVSSSGDVAYENPSSLAVDAKGNVLVGGLLSQPTGTYSGLLMRITSSGVLDASFGNGGRLTLPETSWVRSLAVEENGGVLFAGQARVPNGTTRAFVRRLTPDGKIDGAFSPSWAETDDRSAPAVAVATAGADRRVVGVNTAGRFGVFGIHANGALDASFGDRGFLAVDPLASLNPNSLAPPRMNAQPDGRVVVVGTLVQNTTTTSRAAEVRLTEVGAIDASFGTEGLSRSNVGSSSIATGLAIDAKGRSLLVGSAENQQVAVLERRLPDGRLDPGFGNGGLASSSGGRVGWNGVAIAKDGRIVVVGGITGQSSSIALARYWD